MPTVLLHFGYRFYFYSNENNEPPHIHVEKASGNAKYWLNPIKEAYSYGFTIREKRTIKRLIVKHRESFKNSWDEYFK